MCMCICVWRMACGVCGVWRVACSVWRAHAYANVHVTPNMTCACTCQFPCLWPCNATYGHVTPLKALSASGTVGCYSLYGHIVKWPLPAYHGTTDHATSYHATLPCHFTMPLLTMPRLTMPLPAYHGTTCYGTTYHATTDHATADHAANGHAANDHGITELMTIALLTMALLTWPFPASGGGRAGKRRSMGSEDREQKRRSFDGNGEHWGTAVGQRGAEGDSDRGENGRFRR